MKTKKCRVRVKDIKQGITIYASHPFLGIAKMKILGKPYKNKYGLWVKVKHENGFVTEGSLRDNGITKGDSYNDRRSFFKLKHAEEWLKMSKDEKYIKRHNDHLEWCKEMDEMFDYYY